MPFSPDLCLSVAVRRLDESQGHYAVWVLNAPFPGGYVHRDRHWPPSLSQTWRTWQEMFSTILVDLPSDDSLPPVSMPEPDGSLMNYSSRIMQQLGIELWQWLFDGSIKGSLDHSQGIALGLGKPLRVRLDIRDPLLIGLPWETMQSEPGMQAMSLGQQILFSRTTAAVDPLPQLPSEQSLKVLLVLGQDSYGQPGERAIAAPIPFSTRLKLEQDADALTRALERSTGARLHSQGFAPIASCSVDTLVQPTPKELVARLENHAYNVF
ncbi:MAG: hypothetical protein VKJ64_06165, partial [Leptolyngbyaceae bacterium]|nr:hypothetical protein [Leptolyngbyaceae bacterium]